MNQMTSNDRAEMRHILDLGVSDREKFFIAETLSQWGAIEHEVFLQTLMTFEPGEALPKEMNNIQFSGVLKLWKERVVDQADAEHAEALRNVHTGIEAKQEARNTLVHGMWSWDTSAPGQIFVTRVKRDSVIRSVFDAASLQNLALDVCDLYYKLRYPRGEIDRAEELGENGHSVSRRWVASMSGDPVAADLSPASGD